MADEKNKADEQENDGGENAKPSMLAQHKKKLLLLGLALVLIGVSVGGTLVALKFLSPPPLAEGETEAASEGGEDTKTEPKKQAVYYPLKPPIMVSYDARGRQRLMQAEITLLTRDADVIAAVEAHMPMIRNALVLLMSGQTYEEVQTAEGKELLRVQCLQTLQEILQKEIGKPGIEQVLFTNLILQ